MTSIIGLAGPAGVGKTTVAEALGWRRKSFAAPLKAMLTALYQEAGLDEDQVIGRIYGARKEKADLVLTGRSPRYAMQTLGTEWGRRLMGPDLWVDIAFWDIDARDGQRVVFDDVRFPNEVAEIERRGGVVVELARAGVYYAEDHASAVRVAGLPLVRNDGSPDKTAAAILNRDWSSS